MKNIINIRTNVQLGYYIEIYLWSKYTGSIRRDIEICKYLNIDINFYFQYGKDFNGYIYNNECLYFKKYEDIEKFKNWLKIHIDEFLIIKKIEGK